MKCYANKYCKGYDKHCNEFCDLKLKLDNIYADSQMPLRYRWDKPLSPERVDLPAFKKLKGWQDNVVSHVEQGDNLFLWSNGVGNGKTSWATKIANYYIRKVVATSNMENEVIYISSSTFLETLRAQYDEKDEDFQYIKNRVLTCNLLIIDDLGVEKPTEWVRERLYDIINDRYLNMKSTIYTSNFSISQLEPRVGRRITSRMTESDIVELKGVDRRGM